MKTSLNRSGLLVTRRALPIPYGQEPLAAEDLTNAACGLVQFAAYVRGNPHAPPFLPPEVTVHASAELRLQKFFKIFDLDLDVC
jgi:hypothetical protein